jgi:hypothetical protein
MSSKSKPDHEVSCFICGKRLTGKTAQEASDKADPKGAHWKTHRPAEWEYAFATSETAQPPSTMDELLPGYFGRYIDGRCHLLAIEAETGPYPERKVADLCDETYDQAVVLFASVSLPLPDRTFDGLNDLTLLRQSVAEHSAKRNARMAPIVKFHLQETPSCYRVPPLTRLRRARRRDLENTSREKPDACGQFETALPEIEQLVMQLDYAMILAIEYDGKPAKTPITLPDAEALRQMEAEQEKALRVKGEALREESKLLSKNLKTSRDKAAAQGEIDEALQKQRNASELFLLRCPQCHAEYELSSVKTHCPAAKPGTGAAKKSARGSGKRGRATQAACGAALDLEPTRFARERALKHVQRAFPQLLARHFGSRSVKGEIQAKNGTGGPYDMEERFSKPVTATLHEVLNCLREPMRRKIDGFNADLGELAPSLDGRRDLLPAGATLPAKHVDYHTVRDALICSANRIVGAVARNPEFIEHFGPRVSVSGHIVPWYFPPEIGLPDGKGRNTEQAGLNAVYEEGAEYSDAMTMAEIASALDVKAKRANNRNRDVRKRLPGRIVREGGTYRYRVRLDGLPDVVSSALKRAPM